MKRLLILLLVIIVNTFSGFAQSDAEKFAKRAFREGEYADAIQWYQAAIAQTDDAIIKLSLEKTLAQVKNCATVQKRAKICYEQAKYADAKQAYNNLLSINPSDPTAKKMIAQCDKQIANAAIAAADNKLWEEVVESKDVSLYKEYAARYPMGLHIESANQYIAEDDLWNATKCSHSEDAYRQYLEQSQLQLHKDEAGVQLAYFEDARIWKEVQQKDTETAYRTYITNAGEYARHKSEATAKIALYDAQTEFDAQQYDSARRNFEKAQKYYTLNTQQASLYYRVCEITDFQSMTSYPTLMKGQNFLKAYPSSPHIPEVKDLLAKVYCNEHDFASANDYAQTKDTERYIKEQKKQYLKNNKEEKRRSTQTEYAINIGCDFDIWSCLYSYTIPRVEFSIGNFNNRVNLAMGLQYRRLTGWNKDDSTSITSDLGYDSNNHKVVPFQSGNLPHLVVDQIGLPVTFRCNIGAPSASTKAFIAAGASLNYNFSAKYKRPLKQLSGEDSTYDKFRNPDAALVNRFNVSTYGKIGICWENFDVSIFVRYEATPAFNKNAINTTIMYNDVAPINFYESYKPIRRQTDSKIAIGIAMTWNIPL